MGLNESIYSKIVIDFGGMVTNEQELYSTLWRFVSVAKSSTKSIWTDAAIAASRMDVSSVLTRENVSASR